MLSRVRLFATPWIAAHRASLSITNSRSLLKTHVLKLMSIKSVMPSSHLILCHPLLLPSVFPSIRFFSKDVDFFQKFVPLTLKCIFEMYIWKMPILMWINNVFSWKTYLYQNWRDAWWKYCSFNCCWVTWLLYIFWILTH